MFVDTPQILINPILVGEDQYISVGENKYLEFNNPI